MPLTQNTPKSLLDLGNGETVLECQLNSIRKAGIRDVVLVVGYKANQIEAKIKDLEDIRIKTLYNPFFDSSNNLVSAWLARHEMLGNGFILLNGDDVVKASVFEGLLASPDEITMVINKKDAYDADDMKVLLDGPRVVAVSKQIDARKADAESIGMIKFQRRGSDWMVRKLDEFVRSEEGKQSFYLRAIQAIIDDGFPVHYVECGPEDWAEIDVHPDLDFIRANLDRWEQVVRKWKATE